MLREHSDRSISLRAHSQPQDVSICDFFNRNIQLLEVLQVIENK